MRSSNDEKLDKKLYECVYDSPCGELHIVTGISVVYAVYFDGSDPKWSLSFDDKHVYIDQVSIGMPDVMRETIKWLDTFFEGNDPGRIPEITMSGTAFQEEVWEILRGIPYGTLMTYGEIAEDMAKRRGIKRMSAQAVGNAVGRNPIAILVPCHRVVGSGGSLTGYAGGLERKRFLLELESRRG